MIGIYKITNKINGHCYIGQSINLEKRLASHFTNAYNCNSVEYNKVLYAAIRKYGKENFSAEILELCEQEQLDEREIFWINYYDSYHNGYNATEGGEHGSRASGEDHHKHKLTELEVIDIRNRYANHELKEDVYELYKDKIGKSGFHKIWNGETWKKVHMDVYTSENKFFHYMMRNCHPGKSTGTGNQLNLDEIKDIRIRLKNGESEDQIYNDYKERFTYKQTFTNICRYKTYPYITV